MKIETTPSKRNSIARGGALLGMLALAAGNAHAQNNQATGFRSFIGGGQDNTASAFATSILGGVENTASGANANVLGGQLNLAAGGRSGIFTGFENTVTGAANNGAILTGAFNTVSGNSSAILSGSNNTASGQSSLVLTGKDNTASGNGSVVGGDNSSVSSDDAFVWASDISVDSGSNGTVYFGDDSRGGTVESEAFGPNRMICRFENGITFFTDPFDNDAAVEIKGDDFENRANFGVNRFFSGIQHPIHVGTNTNNGNGARLTATGVWTDASSRTFKENFKPLDSAEVLRKVAGLEVTSWNYKGEEDVLHIGPVAEDFHATFGLGEDEKYLATLDSTGVALAAIKGLNDLVEEKDAKIKELEASHEELNASHEKLANRLEKLESMIKASVE